MEPLRSGATAGAFELSGGRLCLDFANTWGDRSRPEGDRLRGYGDLVAFARQAGIAPDTALEALARRAAADATRSAAVFARAIALRESIARLFTAAAATETFAPTDLERLNAELAEALARLRLESNGEGARWALRLDPAALESPLWPISRSAAELLTSDELARVRRCDGVDCAWLFLDRSRSRSRRWCSMESCGNRAKARRHYRRRSRR